MNPKTKKILKNQLLQKMNDLEQEVARQREILGVQFPTGIEEQIDHVPDQETAAFLLNYEVGLVRKIKSALKRIDEDSYGICQDCGRQIRLRRLKAIPWSPHCIQCQKAIDNRVYFRDFWGGDFEAA
jgi:DnaK suppressor protein